MIAEMMLRHESRKEQKFNTDWRILEIGSQRINDRKFEIGSAFSLELYVRVLSIQKINSIKVSYFDIRD